ncbi:hypothetical protein SAV14893_066390 [Streptomyces avermitilis]|uniref:Uncharacterized protein n=1 Tax=Streptomyces avermitilis TaxID=33903 RepID=A0A4D4M5R7_STRAX|nr:hypothetical protein SAVMC3_79110 [Streptomyces avermitilis]GDY67246.1 hypothetical protein SAV14893_066390 [Streptomyces avermitilis]GDY72465.1 hypothetical protein SAV31267_019500 [Streptomyces avermitilis]GDY81604.1 hypothetical protein SAVCW2_08030 [Streptomyces avermitilis]
MDAARRGHLVASLSLKQEYDCTWGVEWAQIVCALLLGLSTGPSRGEPALHMTYAAQQCAVRDRQ